MTAPAVSGWSTLVERRGFEPLTSAVRGRGWESQYGTGCEGLFDWFPRDGGRRETSMEDEQQPWFLWSRVAR